MAEDRWKEWMHKKPRTPAQLRADFRWRKKSDHLLVSTKMKDFTCYKCKLKYRCTLAFDSYNTDADCLLEK